MLKYTASARDFTECALGSLMMRAPIHDDIMIWRRLVYVVTNGRDGAMPTQYVVR